MLELRRDGDVAFITLDRPEKRNALSIELRLRLTEALEEAGDAHCIVLTGAGSAFCAGMDVSQFGGDEDNRRTLADSSEALFTTLAECPVPLVAAVNGPAMGGGFAVALLCDIRIAARSATFAFPELGRGIPAAYAAARAALGVSVARELCLTGRVIDATEAQRLTVVSEVVDDGDLASRSAAVAGRIATHPPRGTRMVKAWIVQDRERTAGHLMEAEHAAFRAALRVDKPS